MDADGLVDQTVGAMGPTELMERCCSSAVLKLPLGANRISRTTELSLRLDCGKC